MSYAHTTDNIYRYPNIDSEYFEGNAAKKPNVSLPLFVETKNLAPSRTPVLDADVCTIEETSSFKIPLLFRANRLLQVALIVLSAIAIGAYSLDVIMSQNLMLLQEQTRRLSEQNCELSAKLLKSISFQGIQDSVLGHSASQSNLRVPEEVLVAAEIPPVRIEPVRLSKHHLPLMSGY